MFLSLTRHGDVPGDVSGELDDVRKVVLVPAVVLATVRLKQVITWKRLYDTVGTVVFNFLPVASSNAMHAVDQMSAGVP